MSTPHLLAVIEKVLAHFGGVVEKEASVLVHLPAGLWEELMGRHQEAAERAPSRVTSAAHAALMKTAQVTTTPLGTTVQFNAGVAAELQAAHAEATASPETPSSPSGLV